MTFGATGHEGIRMVAINATNLTSRQRRELESARTVTADVRAYAVGRASARWSDGAKWVTGIFTTLFVFALVVLHVVLIPGFLVVYVLYDSVRPRRGLAVTAAGVTEMKLSLMNGKPSAVVGSSTHAALFSPGERSGGRTVVRLPAEDVSLKDADLQRLQAAAAAAAPPMAQPATGILPPPPPLS
jgi:hypothetical protein